MLTVDYGRGGLVVDYVIKIFIFLPIFFPTLAEGKKIVGNK